MRAIVSLSLLKAFEPLHRHHTDAQSQGSFILALKPLTFAILTRFLFLLSAIAPVCRYLCAVCPSPFPWYERLLGILFSNNAVRHQKIMQRRDSFLHLAIVFRWIGRGT